MIRKIDTSADLVVKVIKYKTGSPKARGVYACRVPKFGVQGLLEDVFLFWQENKWWYLSSDQGYRGTVLGWIGPLQRKMDEL